MNKEMEEALKLFGRQDLIDSPYENDMDDNIEVFLTIRQMIKIVNKYKKLDAIKFYIEQSDIKNMLWGKEILKIIGGNDESKRDV